MQSHKIAKTNSLERTIMTLMLELAPEVQEALMAEAHRQGTTPELLAAEELRSRFTKPIANAEDTLRQALARLLDQAGTLEPHSLAHTPKYDTAFGEILREKYRKQGFRV